VRIPVEKDDFDLEHATVPAGLRLVRVREGGDGTGRNLSALRGGPAC
jgi:hypothetical protein